MIYGLKRLCEAVLVKAICLQNLVPILEAANHYSASHLQQVCPRLRHRLLTLASLAPPPCAQCQPAYTHAHLHACVCECLCYKACRLDRAPRGTGSVGPGAQGQ